MQAEVPDDDWDLVDRVIVLRTHGWSFERIGAQLAVEGFEPTNPAARPAQILRRLVQKRDP